MAENGGIVDSINSKNASAIIPNNCDITGKVPRPRERSGGTWMNEIEQMVLVQRFNLESVDFFQLWIVPSSLVDIHA